MRLIILAIAFVNMFAFLHSSSHISIVKTGEESVRLGKRVTYNITIKNHSSVAISNIVIKDKIPAGFKYREHDTGTFALRWNIETLRANEKRSFRYILQTKQEGKFTSKTYLYIDGKKNHEVSFITAVVKPKITMDVSCPGIAYLGKRVRATITIKNNGSMNLNGIALKGNGSSECQILAGEGNPIITGVSAVWSVDTLAVGETKSYSITIISKDCGEQCFSATVDSNEGASAQAECYTLWKCCFGLLLEVIDTADPLVAGEETTYVIEVTNQGGKTDYDIRIDAVFPAEISPISAQGDTFCTVSGKRVTVDSYPMLKKKEKIRWKIRAKAIQPGDSRLKVYLSSRALRKPVTEEESTHVY